MPQVSERDAMSMYLSTYAIVPDGIRFVRNRVGPVTNTKKIAPSVRVMLMLERMRTPLDTPETAEIMKPVDSSMMMAMSTPVDTSMPPTMETPSVICRDATPREAAVPKRVATIARMSTIFPVHAAPPLVSGVKMEDMRETRPRRYVE